MTTQRYALAALVGLVYALATAWLVGAEGRAYRAELREARSQRPEAAAVAVAPKESRAAVSAGSGDPRRAAAERAGGIGPLSPDAERRAGGVSPLSPKEPGKSAEPSITAGPVPADSATAPTVALKVPAPKPLTIPKAVPPVERSAGEIWADTLDLAAITPEREMRLGGELHKLVIATTPVDRDGDVERLRRSADPLLKLRTRPEINYTFTVLDSPVVNAFSLPGGFIYVSKGLFTLLGEEVEPDEDYALQFALGHEIAHVDLRHALKLLAPGNSDAKAKGVDTLHQCLLPLMVAYPDAMEFEADAWAFKQMTNRIEPRRTRREALMFLIKFQGFAEKNGFRNGRMSLDPASGQTLVENHYRAHPGAWERLDRLRSSSTPAQSAAPKSR